MRMGEVSSFRRDASRFKLRCKRAEGVRSRAVERAVNRTRRQFEGTRTKRIKHPDGRIEDWVRNLVVELVALDGVPTAKVPQVIERVRQSLIPSENRNEHDGQTSGDTKERISDRSVRRMLVEAYVKAFLRAAELFNRTPCQH